MPLRRTGPGPRRTGCEGGAAARRWWFAPFALAVLVTLAASPALPHSRLETTAPADGAVLERAPEHVVLTFANGLRLTRVVMSHNDGAEIELDPGPQTGFSTRFELAIEDRGSGQYRIEWRGLSADGHVMRNAFEFRVP